MDLPPFARDAVARAREGHVVVLTGAGISAESGIPTFRGPEGYWRIGSANYFPEQLARSSAFREMPDEIWSWYLYRRSVCRAARPNAAHDVLARLEERLLDRFTLVTQNVDGLHLRAGNTRMRTLEIHGNTDYLRCFDECGAPLGPMPDALLGWSKDRALDDDARRLLRCAACGGWARPHVLWFDECYDEEKFRANSALRAVARADLLVLVGTAGATNLPTQIVHHAAAAQVPILLVNVEETVFSPLARGTGGGDLLGPATQWVPLLAGALSS